VTTVVDSGLVRKPEFDLRTGMTRLNTQRISRASSVQRAGRAGRLGPGVCYRLWSEDQQAQLARYSTPEILASDLAPLMLQLLQWGIGHPQELQWLDLPSSSAVNQALDLLQRLGAVDKSNSQRLTAHGERMAKLPLHPRLSHMLLCSVEMNAEQLACHIAAALSEKIPSQNAGADFMPIIDMLLGARVCDKKDMAWLQRGRQMANSFLAQITPLHSRHKKSMADKERTASALLACAYPDRIARRRAQQRESYQLSNGRAVVLPSRDALSNHEWLVVCEVGGSSGQSADRMSSESSCKANGCSRICCLR
jgi:ATP-dependent helicase HrpB